MKKEEIGSKLQEYRVRAGLTQKDVALAIQRPQPTIAAWEKGRSQPDADTLYSLLLLLKCPQILFLTMIFHLSMSHQKN